MPGSMGCSSLCELSSMGSIIRDAESISILAWTCKIAHAVVAVDLVTLAFTVGEARSTGMTAWTLL